MAGVLRKNPVFGSLPDPEIRALASLARRDRVRARQWVFLEGDPAQWLCLVECGRVKIVRQARTGKEVTLELLGAGEVFGGVAVIERRPYPASAQATETSVIVKLPGHAVASVADRHPSLIREMALMIGRRLRTAHDSVTSLSADHVEARLAATLLRLAEREGGRTAQGLTLPFHLTRQALADMAGTTVETTIRMVRRWIKSGVVADAGGRLVIKDLAALRTRATGQPG
ncbi:MAG: Crp/Fnr family transcriptional regulator [Candidatus Rokubacteria bacterium]|nr:Crp/Fnr family transcriptional regulator [Candidatus Rokubacteria bacterium]